MGDKTGIAWTDSTWLVPEMLDKPLRWQKPRRIFVDSMSDLFYEAFTNEEIAAVFGVMAAASRHTFQVLTKRPKRMREWFEWVKARAASCVLSVSSMCLIEAANRTEAIDFGSDARWPLPNVWLGVSVEDQATADERIPQLLATPAAVSFVSYEPALGPVDFSRFMWPVHARWPAGFSSPEDAAAAGAEVTHHRQALVSAHARFLDWLIIGGESGQNARTCDVEWIRSVVRQCKAAGVALFVKQLGAVWARENGAKSRSGADQSEWPEDLRVQEFPRK